MGTGRSSLAKLYDSLGFQQSGICLGYMLTFAFVGKILTFGVLSWSIIASKSMKIWLLQFLRGYWLIWAFSKLSIDRCKNG